MKNQDFVAGNFPLYEAEPLSLHAPRLEDEARDLLQKLLQFESKHRLQALESMRHPYFHSLGQRIHQLHNTVSIFTLPECKLAPNPGQRRNSVSSLDKPYNRGRRDSQVHATCT